MQDFTAFYYFICDIDYRSWLAQHGDKRCADPHRFAFLNSFGVSGFVALPGIVMAAFCSMFIGTEFSDGTMRNKLIVGHRRREIYFTNFLTCALSGIFLIWCIWLWFLSSESRFSVDSSWKLARCCSS